jgi:hypothetical protein
MEPIKIQENFKCQAEDALKALIKACFQDQDDQGNVIINLYKMVYPDWDRIKTIQGHPEIGNALWKFICREFIEFDQKYHPDCFAGGAWINQGFSVDKVLGPWEISLKNTTITYQN